MRPRYAALALLAAAGCGTFEDPAIVLDLRVLDMVADPPEQLVPYDPDTPPRPQDVHLAPIRICGLVADPAEDRRLLWSMYVCGNDDDLRCRTGGATFRAGAGRIDDPDAADAPQSMCAVITPSDPPGPDDPLVAVITEAIRADPLAGFGGVDVTVGLRVVPIPGSEEDAVYAAKRIRFAPQVPVERTPNQNPSLERIDASIGDAAPTPLPLGRCRDQAAPIEMHVGDELHLEPVEPPGAREEYVVPTFDGGSRMFTENLRYQWLAGAGSWQRADTGGQRDPFGNDPPLDTRYRTPPAKDVTGPVDVPLWILQRDERLGGAWYESCVRVLP